MDRYSELKNAISHNVHELKSSAADDINIILPSRKVEARGSHQFQQNFNALQSSFLFLRFFSLVLFFSVGFSFCLFFLF